MTNKVMHKRQLVDLVARRSGPSGLTRRQVREALHLVLDVITDEMAEGSAVTIAGFGRFEATEHRGRTVIGLDGDAYQVDTRLVPSFRPYVSLRLKVQRTIDERLTPKPGEVPLFWSDDANS